MSGPWPGIPGNTTAHSVAATFAARPSSAVRNAAFSTTWPPCEVSPGMHFGRPAHPISPPPESWPRPEFSVSARSWLPRLRLGLVLLYIPIGILFLVSGRLAKTRGHNTVEILASEPVKYLASPLRSDHFRHALSTSCCDTVCTSYLRRSPIPSTTVAKAVRRGTIVARERPAAIRINALAVPHERRTWSHMESESGGERRSALAFS